MRDDVIANLTPIMDAKTLSKVNIDLIVAPVINFAMQQNHVPIVKRLLITNTSDSHLENLSVEISTEPDFSIPWIAKVDQIKPEESYSFGVVPINLSPIFLAESTERISGRLHLKIKSLDETLLESVYEIDLLAYDQWNGAGS